MNDLELYGMAEDIFGVEETMEMVKSGFITKVMDTLVVGLRTGVITPQQYVELMFLIYKSVGREDIFHFAVNKVHIGGTGIRHPLNVTFHYHDDVPDHSDCTVPVAYGDEFPPANMVEP